jgi:hypothetical protein
MADMRKRRARLTERERDALETVALEFLAGHDAELTRAAGLAETVEEAARLLDALNSAVRKL